MKRNTVSLLTLAAAALVFMGAGMEERKRRPRGGSAQPQAPRISQPERPRAAQPERTRGVEPERTRGSEPHRTRTAQPEKRQGIERRPAREDGGARQSRPASQRIRHAGVAATPGITRNMARIERSETTPNRHYWHTEGGTRYSHYYDGGTHWYGFYSGPTFYWTRYYGSNWWWYDSYSTRWVYWADGFWWWPGPGGVAYVYVDDGYYPYSEPVVSVAAAPSVPAPDKGATTVSSDGRRMAQVFGPDSQSFLYDTTRTPPTFLRYLGQGVSRVRFTDGAILVDFHDGSFALFDEEGRSMKASSKAEGAARSAPPAPGSVPPAPPSGN